MTTFKQTVLDIKDYISLETAVVERILETDVTMTEPRKLKLQAEIETLKDISDIIKENGQ